MTKQVWLPGPVNVIRRSLMFRVLLPIGVLLIVMVVGSVIGVAVKDGHSARASLSAKAKLIADIAGRGSADAIWNIDAQLAKASLSALAVDPDYVGSELTDDHGKPLATDGGTTTSTGALIVEKVPVIRGDGDQQKTIGTLVLRVSTARADAEIARGSLELGIIGAAALIVVYGLLFWILRRATRPIVTLTDTMAKLSSGEFDSDIPALNRADEVGRMARAVEVFKENAVERARLEAAQKIQADRAAQEKHAAVLGMAEKIEAETASVLESVSTRTAAMAATAEEMRASANRTGESAQGAATAAAQALANAQTVASAAEQLATSIHEIGSQVSQSTVLVGRAVTVGGETRATMEELNTQVGRIGAVAEMIAEIAARTNLLALNATIEAARAGDAGKGFAVVASEVKALATQTAHSTEEITRHIGEVRAATGASVAAVGRIEQTIGEVDAIASSIAAAVEEQGAATAEIARNVTQTAEAAHEMTRRIDEVSAEAEHTGQHSARVRDDTTALNTIVGALQHSLIRVVRTSTEDADRRQFPRMLMNLPCRVTVAGGGGQAATIANISKGGALVTGGPVLPVGARGTLEGDRVGMPLAFVVRACGEEGLHMAFDIDATSANRFAEVVERLTLQRAA